VVHGVNVVNVLAPNDAYAAPQGAGFYSQTMQDMHRPVMTMLVQHYWFSPFCSYFFFCEILHEKLNPVI
jgi:hypothetical protein